MAGDVDVDLGAVQETLLIPLLGRARATEKGSGMIDDPKAVEIVRSLDYDFSKWEGAPSLAGATLRTRMFDRFVERFLDRHPEGTVVELGCGLNTRFERTDNGTATWFELDLPDAIELRRRFFDDGPRHTMLAASMLETGWMDAVAATEGPWLFVSEAVLIYLDEPQVRQVVSNLAERFDPMWLAFDTTDQKMVDGQARHDAMKHLPQESWFRWACADPTVVESWAPSLSVVESQTFVDADDELRRHMPLVLRLLSRYAPFVLRARLSGYRLNLATTEPRAR